MRGKTSLLANNFSFLILYCNGFNFQILLFIFCKFIEALADMCADRTASIMLMIHINVISFRWQKYEEINKKTDLDQDLYQCTAIILTTCGSRIIFGVIEIT
jgi:hypothetical protein